MAYTYRNKKTGEVIYLNRRAKSAFWEEVEPEQEETFEEDDIEEDDIEEDDIEENPLLDVIPAVEVEPEKPVEKPPKKTTKSRGK